MGPMGIRRRVLALTMAVALPLVTAGLVGLVVVWRASRSQLESSVQQQAELAALALERWIEAQRQPVTAVAAYASVQQVRPELFQENLRSIVATREHWMDLRLIDENGLTRVAYPPGPPPLAEELIDALRAGIARRGSWAVLTYAPPALARPVTVIGAPIHGGGLAVARVDGMAMQTVFQGIRLGPGTLIAVFDPPRRPLHFSPASADGAMSGHVGGLLDSLATGQAVVDDSAPDGVRRVFALRVAGASECLVVVGVPALTLYEPARRQLTRYAAFSVLALLCAAGAALLIGGRLATPVRELGEVARRLGAGDLDARARPEGTAETAELARAFNAMASRLQEREARLDELDQLKSDFVSGVSHELRTPLTTIKTLTRVLLKEGRSPAERREHLESIAAECDRQIELVVNLLDLSRIEAGAFSVAAEPVAVAQVVADALSARRRALEARGHHVRTDVPDGLPPLWAERATLLRVLGILLDNAGKYTAEGGTITVSAAPDGAQIAVAVSDTGTGIASEDRPHVFEKFYRGRSGASGLGGTDPPGVGLGLFLARIMVERLGGTIEVDSAAGRGSTFTIRLASAAGPETRSHG
jgi:signal transduction histidine kinase